MKVWDIIQRVCKLPQVEVMSLSIRLKLHHNDYVSVEWADKVATDTPLSLRPGGFWVDFSESTLNRYGQNRLIVDLFEVLKSEPDTKTKQEEPNQPPQVAP